MVENGLLRWKARLTKAPEQSSNEAPLLPKLRTMGFFVNKVLLTHRHHYLISIYGCFCATKAVKLQQKPHGLQKLKHLHLALYRKHSWPLLWNPDSGTTHAVVWHTPQQIPRTPITKAVHYFSKGGAEVAGGSSGDKHAREGRTIYHLKNKGHLKKTRECLKIYNWT